MMTAIEAKKLSIQSKEDIWKTELNSILSEIKTQCILGHRIFKPFTQMMPKVVVALKDLGYEVVEENSICYIKW